MMENNLAIHCAIVVLPLVLSNTLHMLIIKSGHLNILNTPISNKHFGSNKTWRGIAVVPIANSAIVPLICRLFKINLTDPALLGAILGLSYMIFELPNSYLKRKLMIAPGQQSHSYSNLFKWIDKSDSAFGVSLVYSLLGYIIWKQAILLFLISSTTHAVISLVLVKLKIKSSF